MFPALKQAWRELREGFGTDPVSLGLGKKDFSFGPDVNIDWYRQNGYYGIYNALSGGSPAWSGEVVSVDTALNHSVVWACNRIISESVAFLPLVLMQETSKGKYPANGTGDSAIHPLYNAIGKSPNDEMTSMGWRETLTSHVVLGGNAYSLINRRSGTNVATGFQLLMPSQVRIDREKEGQKRLVYLVKDGNSQEKTYTVVPGKPHDILHIRGLGTDGLRGYSVITMARQSIGAAIGAERFTAKFWAGGGRVPYVLKLAQKFKDDQAAEKFREDWERVYSDPHRAPILEPWLTYEQIGMSLHDSQLIESRQFSIPEICRWFLISPHLVGDLSRATFSNIEQLALEFVKMTLTAWITRWEQELWRCVLTPDEKSAGYYFKHNLNGLLRGDFASRMAGYASALQNGHLNVDEVRDLEDRNPLPDGAGEHYHIQLNMQTLPSGNENLPSQQEIAPTQTTQTSSPQLVRLTGRKLAAA